MFGHLDNFIENEKAGNHLVQGLGNMVNGGRTDRPKSDIFPVCDSCRTLRCVIIEKYNFLLCGAFS